VLLRGLYDYAAEHGIPLLDLGTSTVDGKPNFGLLSFKTRLGAELTPKISFAKRLA
jgi:lipid II:glycine glycyltransferase (peptidoglycan interpeptide bridge formation enzyme)